MIFSNTQTQRNIRSFGTTEGDPKIIFKYKSLVMMKKIVDKLDKEVGWLGIVERVGDHTYIVSDIHVPKQEANGATCEITPEGLAELVSTLPGEQVDKVRLWGHSHGKGGVFASAQDDTQAMETLKNCQDYLIRVICNQAGVMSVSFFDYVNKKIYENINWFYDDGIDHKAMEKEIGETIEKNVKDFKTTYTPPSVNAPGYEGHRFYDDYDGYGGYRNENQWPLLNKDTERQFDKEVRQELAKSNPNLKEEFYRRTKQFRSGKANFHLAK